MFPSCFFLLLFIFVNVLSMRRCRCEANVCATMENAFAKRKCSVGYTTSVHSFVEQQWKRIHHAKNLWVMAFSLYSLPLFIVLQADESMSHSLFLLVRCSPRLWLRRMRCKEGKKSPTSYYCKMQIMEWRFFFGKEDDYFTIALLCGRKQWNRTNEH